MPAVFTWNPPPLTWVQFVPKYLEEASPGVAHVLAAIPGKGAVPPQGSAATGGAQSPDGSDAQPFRVTPEFELTVTSTAPRRETGFRTTAATALRIDSPYFFSDCM